jgi:hypothetical protein
MALEQVEHSQIPLGKSLFSKEQSPHLRVLQYLPSNSQYAGNTSTLEDLLCWGEDSKSSISLSVSDLKIFLLLVFFRFKEVLHYVGETPARGLYRVQREDRYQDPHDVPPDPGLPPQSNSPPAPQPMESAIFSLNSVVESFTTLLLLFFSLSFLFFGILTSMSKIVNPFRDRYTYDVI